MTLLEVKSLSVRFGGLTAVDGVDLEVPAGAIFSIIGPNGAGKTTLFNAVSGIYEPNEGRIFFDGRDLRQALTRGAYGAMVAVALVTGIGAALAFSLEPLWTATVTANFVYQQPFPWLKALGDFLGFFSVDPLRLLPSAAGAAVGFAGAFVVWRRSSLAPDTVSRRGIARTFQNIRLFQDMTVLENVLTGMDAHFKTPVWRMAHRKKESADAATRATELLAFVGLESPVELGKNLSYGLQRRLEIARAMATRPKLLLLDEPAAGMNPAEAASLMDLIRRIRDSGVTVVLIEHQMRVVMGISDRIAVLDYGHKIAEGAPKEIACDPRVVEAYLGKEEAL